MLNFALLGCGRIGKMHANILATLEQTNLVCVYDLSSDNANTVANKYNTQSCKSAEEAINHKDVQAVLIATSTDTHSDFIEMVAKAGKPIMCEKPIDLSLERVLACKKVLDENPVPVQIGFNRRFDPGHAATHKALQEGQIGELLHMVITSRDPEMQPRAYYEVAGGLFRDMTIHDFDLARFFLSEEPTEAFAVGGRLCNPVLMDELDDHDSGMIILRTPSGKLCHINNTRAAVYGYDQRLEVHGNKGMILSNNLREHNIEISNATQSSIKLPPHHFYLDRYRRSFELEIMSFADSIINNKATKVTFSDGVRALQLAEACYNSIKSGKMEPIAPLN